MEEPGQQKLLCDVEIRSGLFYQQSLVCYFDVSDPEGAHLEVNVRTSASIKMVLKKDFEPGLFDYDATARELEGGEYIITLSRLTKPRLCVGRYYIEITGKAFMKRSNFSILVTFEVRTNLLFSSSFFLFSLSSYLIFFLLPSPCFKTETDRLLKKTYDEVVVEEVYENQQRVSPFNTFSFEGLTNWPPWSDLKGDPRPCKEDTPLPDFNWFWASDWKISPRPVTGLDGMCLVFFLQSLTPSLILTHSLTLSLSHTHRAHSLTHSPTHTLYLSFRGSFSLPSLLMLVSSPFRNSSHYRFRRLGLLYTLGQRWLDFTARSNKSGTSSLLEDSTKSENKRDEGKRHLAC
jgi:hypothetical protein